MKLNKIFLGLCATGMAVTGAFAAFLSSPQTDFYVRRADTNASVKIQSVSCGTGSFRCRIKLINGTTVISTATTVFSNIGLSTAYPSSVNATVATINLAN